MQTAVYFVSLRAFSFLARSRLDAASSEQSHFDFSQFKTCSDDRHNDTPDPISRVSPQEAGAQSTTGTGVACATTTAGTTAGMENLGIICSMLGAATGGIADTGAAAGTVLGGTTNAGAVAGILTCTGRAAAMASASSSIFLFFIAGDISALPVPSLWLSTSAVSSDMSESPSSRSRFSDGAADGAANGAADGATDGVAEGAAAGSLAPAGITNVWLKSGCVSSGWDIGSEVIGIAGMPAGKAGIAGIVGMGRDSAAMLGGTIPPGIGIDDAGSFSAFVSATCSIPAICISCDPRSSST